MKKIFLLTILFLVSFSLLSCGKKGDIVVYYGVATLYNGDSGSEKLISIPELGLVYIPDMSVEAFFFGEEIADYEIAIGDLIEITFYDSSDVEILESNPSSFKNNPDKILVQRKGYVLENETTDLFTLTIPDSSFHDSPQEIINNLTVDTTYRILTDEAAVLITEITITEIQNHSLVMTVDKDAIHEVLKGLFLSNIVLGHTE